MNLMQIWDDQAEEWIEWVRGKNDDSYIRFHREQFLALVPDAGRATLDIGCGEGRFTRELAAKRHTVVGIDRSRKLIAAARSWEDGIRYEIAEAASLPFDDGTFDIVVGFMFVHVVHDLDAVLSEVVRVLRPKGRLVLALPHPLNTSGSFISIAPTARFEIEGSYLEQFAYARVQNRDASTIRLVGIHRPIECYVEALSHSGLLIDRLLEVGIPSSAFTDESNLRWKRIPLFLHLRAVHAP